MAYVLRQFGNFWESDVGKNGEVKLDTFTVVYIRNQICRILICPDL